jgi:3-deoxy-7-phosphoheptulonate synthase
MSVQRTNDLRVTGLRPLVSPADLKAALPLTEQEAAVVERSRETVGAIMTGRDQRLLAIVGPCSIHDEKAALEYASRLAELHRKLIDRLFIVMRVYFEKPRTTLGWRGFIIDPLLDGTYDIGAGLFKARRLLLEINRMNLPTGTEMLDPIVPQYTADLVTWSAIGARTTESQTHRDMASGLSMTVGFKNNTDGDIQSAVDAILASARPHSFLGIDQNGQTCVVSTAGNPSTHIILRGGRRGGNFRADMLEEAAFLLKKAGLPPVFVVDCSHGNSEKDHTRQELVLRSILASRRQGVRGIQGFMLESNLNEGNQALGKAPSALAYGVSITDACIGWEKTAELLQLAYDQSESQ